MSKNIGSTQATAPTVRKGSGGNSGSTNSNLQIDQIDEVMKRISSTINDKLTNESVYFFICLLSTATQYFSIYRLNVYIFNFRLFLYSILVMTRRFVSRIIKAREASDPLALQPTTPILKVIHTLIVVDIIYLAFKLFQETQSYTSLLLLAYYHLIYFKYGSSVTEKEHQFGFNHDLSFYVKVMAIKLSEIIYFSYLLPLKFIDEDVHYDQMANLAVAAITSLNLLLFFAMEVFINIGMVNKMQAKKQGCWKSISAAAAAQQNVFEWKENQPYKRNIVVSFNSRWYRSQGKTNLAQPGSIKQTLFYLVFHKVQKSRKALIIMSGFLMVLQDFLILKTTTPVTYALTLVQTLVVSVSLIVQNRRQKAN